MNVHDEFICSIYVHSTYGKLADIGFCNCHFAPDLEYNGVKGVPEFLIFDGNGNTLCSEFKGHISAIFSEKIKEDIEQYKKYQRIVCKENSNPVCQPIKIRDISMCYTNYWLEKYHDDMINKFSKEGVNPIVWKMEKEDLSGDIFILGIDTNHTISSLQTLMEEGLKTTQRDIHKYIVLDHNVNNPKLYRYLGSALLVLASLRIEKFNLDMLKSALSSIGVILANNQDLYRRITRKLNSEFKKLNLVIPEGADEWSIRIDIDSGQSRTAWTKRLEELLKKFGDQSDFFIFG